MSSPRESVSEVFHRATDGADVSVSFDALSREVARRHRHRVTGTVASVVTVVAALVVVTTQLSFAPSRSVGPSAQSTAPTAAATTTSPRTTAPTKATTPAPATTLTGTVPDPAICGPWSAAAGSLARQVKQTYHADLLTCFAVGQSWVITTDSTGRGVVGVDRCSTRKCLNGSADHGDDHWTYYRANRPGTIKLLSAPDGSASILLSVGGRTEEFNMDTGTFTAAGSPTLTPAPGHGQPTLTVSAMLGISDQPRGSWGTPPWTEALDPSRLKHDTGLDFSCQRRPLVDARASLLRRLYDSPGSVDRTAVEHVELAPNAAAAAADAATVSTWLSDCQQFSPMPAGSGAILQQLKVAEHVALYAGGSVYVNTPSENVLGTAVGVGRVGRAVIVYSVISEAAGNGDSTGAKAVAVTLGRAMARLHNAGF